MWHFFLLKEINVIFNLRVWHGGGFGNLSKPESVNLKNHAGDTSFFTIIYLFLRPV